MEKLGREAKISGLELFGLISGVIGLVADITSLTMLFGNLATPGNYYSTLFFFFIFFCSIPLIVVCGYYVRLLLVLSAYKEAETTLIDPNYEEIERASLSINMVIGAMFLLINIIVFGVYISQLGVSLIAIFALFFFLVFPLGVVLVMSLDLVGYFVFRALHPVYKDTHHAFQS